uniref:hypothetical protein n=2 Tax=Aeromonas caviae TaxID=648 RepID=UPI001FC7EFFC
ERRGEVFRLNRNERSHWSGNGVHVESELVFMIGRNMQYLLNGCACVGIGLVIPAGCQYFPANSHYLVGQGDKDHMMVMAGLQPSDPFA